MKEQISVERKSEKQKVGDEKTRDKFFEFCQKKGNLTDKEIVELVRYAFGKRPTTVKAQFRYNYLLLKNRYPDQAAQFKHEVGTINEAKLDEARVKEICRVMAKFVKGFSIKFGERTFGTSTIHESWN